MKFQLLALLCFFCLNALSAQMSAKYYHDDGKEISKERFEKLNAKGDWFPIEVLYEDEVNYHLEKREVKGKLSSEVLATLKAIVPALDPGLSVNNLIVVSYYPGRDNCNKNFVDSGRFNEYYTDLRSILQMANGNPPIYIYRSAEGIAGFAEALKFFPDPNDFFRKTFFQNQYPCSSFVVVDKDGVFYAYKGEHSSESILEVCRKMRT